jgi:sec-independent protein translocase protein TatA
MPLGGAEILIVALLIFFFFGARRLPEFGRSLGAGMREFKHSVTTRGEEPEDTPETIDANLPAATGSSPAGARKQPDADRVSN